MDIRKISASDDLYEGELFKSKHIEVDEDLKLEFIAEEYDEELTKNDVYRDLQRVEETLCGTEKYTNHADILDYSIAVTSGIINGMIDSFFIGEWDFEAAKAKSNQYMNEKVMNFAKKQGFTGDRLADAVEFLEKKYPLPGDDAYKNVLDDSGKQVMTMKTHHLDDLSHHPTLIGLIASIVVQFSGEAIYLPAGGGVARVPVEVNDYGNFTGTEAGPKVFAGVINWFFNVVKETIANTKGHWMSDLAGSHMSAGGGMGLPGSLLSILKELSLLPCFTDSNFREDLRKAYHNGIGDGKSQVNFGLFNELFKGASSKFDARTELAVKSELERQALPVILNEMLVRGFYFIRRFIDEMKNKNSILDIDWNNVLPVNNRTIVRMLTISKGTFTAFDAADAAIRSKGLKTKFILRVNFVGIGSFALTSGIDIGMGVKKFIKEKQYGNPKNLKLIRLYEKNAKGLSLLFNNNPALKKATGPLFIHFDENKYNKKKFKVMFIGLNNQVTKKYMRERESGLISMFEETKSIKPKGFFGKFARTVSSELNNDKILKKEPYYIWNSLFKFGTNTDEIVNDENTYFNVLKKEIAICKPDVIVFATGSEYDEIIRQKLGDYTEFEEIATNSIWPKTCPDLDVDTFARIKTAGIDCTKHIYRIPDVNKISFRLFQKNYVSEWIRRLVKQGEEKAKTNLETPKKKEFAYYEIKKGKEVPVKKQANGKTIVSWIFGAIFFIAGLLVLLNQDGFDDSSMLGVILVLTGIFNSPLVFKRMPMFLKYLLTIVFVVIGMFLSMN